jgi:hypothetical protein
MLKRRGSSPACVSERNLNTERGKSPLGPAAPGACPPRQKSGHPLQERPIRARTSIRYVSSGSRAIWRPRHARTNTLPRRHLVCELAGCWPIHRSCRIEGVASSYSYVLACMSPTVVTLVNSASSFRIGACAEKASSRWLARRGRAAQNGYFWACSVSALPRSPFCLARVATQIPRRSLVEVGAAQPPPETELG